MLSVGSWSIQFWPTVGLVLLAIIYFRGWLKLRKQVPHRFDGWRLASFLGGVGTVFLALVRRWTPSPTCCCRCT